MPTFTIIDGFEHGRMAFDASGRYAVIVGTPTIVTATPRTGARCLELSPALGAPDVVEHPSFATQTGVLSFYILFPTALPATGGEELLLLDNLNGNLLLEFVLASAKLRLHADTGNLNNQFGPALVADTWYRVDLMWDTRANPGIFKGRVDDHPDEGLVQPAQAALNVTAALIGGAGNGVDIYTARWDDFVMSETLADYPIGEHSVHKLSPSADGTHNIATSGNFDDITDAFSNATTTSWQNIDDVPLDTVNTADNIIRQDISDTSGYMEHTFEDLPAGTDVPMDIVAYDLDVDSATAGTNLNIYRILLSDSTAVTPDVRLSTDDPGLTVTMRKKMLGRPAGGWTRDNVNGLKSRWGFGDGTPDAHLLGAMLEVAVVPAAVATVEMLIAADPNYTTSIGTAEALFPDSLHVAEANDTTLDISWSDVFAPAPVEASVEELVAATPHYGTAPGTVEALFPEGLTTEAWTQTVEDTAAPLVAKPPAVSALGETWDTNAGNKTVTATPAVDDLIVVVAGASGMAGADDIVVADDQSGTYTRIARALGGGTAGMVDIWIRDSLVASAVSTVYTATITGDTGGGLTVLKATGMSRAGADASRQFAAESTQTESPVVCTFPAAPLSANACIAGVFGEDNPAALTIPSGWDPEATDTGWATPTSGIWVGFRSSGETSDVITWGGGAFTDHCEVLVELDTSVPASAEVVNADPNYTTSLGTVEALHPDALHVAESNDSLDISWADLFAVAPEESIEHLVAAEPHYGGSAPGQVEALFPEEAGVEHAATDSALDVSHLFTIEDKAGADSLAITLTESGAVQQLEEPFQVVAATPTYQTDYGQLEALTGPQTAQEHAHVDPSLDTTFIFASIEQAGADSLAITLTESGAVEAFQQVEEIVAATPTYQQDFGTVEALFAPGATSEQLHVESVLDTSYAFVDVGISATDTIAISLTESASVQAQETVDGIIAEQSGESPGTVEAIHAPALTIEDRWNVSLDVSWLFVDVGISASDTLNISLAESASVEIVEGIEQIAAAQPGHSPGTVEVLWPAALTAEDFWNVTMDVSWLFVDVSVQATDTLAITLAESGTVQVAEGIEQLIAADPFYGRQLGTEEALRPAQETSEAWNQTAQDVAWLVADVTLAATDTIAISLTESATVEALSGVTELVAADPNYHRSIGSEEALHAPGRTIEDWTQTVEDITHRFAAVGPDLPPSVIGKTGVAEPGVGKTGVAEPGVSKTGVAEPGVSKDGSV